MTATGVDLGSAFARVARRGGDGAQTLVAPAGAAVGWRRPDWVPPGWAGHGLPADDAAVPVALAYAGQRRLIGAAAHDAIAGGTALAHSGFTAALPTTEPVAHSGARPSPGTAERATGDFLTALFADADLADPVVLTVPDCWLGAGDAGLAGQLALRRLATRANGGREPRLVGAALCAAAALALPRPAGVGDSGMSGGGHPGDGVYLLCDVGAATLTVAVVALEGQRVRLIDIDHVPAQVDGSQPPAAGALFGQLAAQRLLGRWADGPAAGAFRRDLEREAVTRAHRAWIAVRRAATDERYGDTPVYWLGSPADPRPLTAQALVECFAPVAAAVRAATARVVGRLREADEALPVVLVGGFSSFPIVEQAVRAGLRDAGRAPGHHTTGHGATGYDSGNRLGPGSDPRVLRLGPAAAAAGALLIAEHTVVAEDHYPHTLVLAMRQIRAGRLVDEPVTIATAGQPAPHTVGTPAGPLVVRVEGTLTALTVRVSRDGTSPWEELTIRMTPPPPGTYQLGLVADRSTRLGALVLRPEAPEGAGDALVIALV